MKNRKICFLLFIVQLVLCFSFSVSAATNDVAFTLEGTPSTVKAGETFVVVVGVSENAGFKSAIADVEYDAEKLTLVNSNVVPTYSVSAINAETKGVVVVSIGDIWDVKTNPNAPVYNGVGQIAILTFKAADSKADYNTTVKIDVTNKDVSDKNGKTKTYTVAGDEKTITVLGSEHKDPVIKTAALELRDNLAINFKVEPQVGYENYAIKFVFNGEETVVTEYTVEEGTGRYVFPFTNIAPNQMADTITATLTTTFAGEEVVCNTVNYSAATYCYNQLAKDLPADLKTLLVDLLNYGSAAQTYTKYNTEALVNADLTDVQKSWATAETPAVENKQNTAHKVVENAVATWKGAGLNLTETVCIRLKFAAESIEGLSVKIATDSNSWTIPASEFEAAGNGAYYVYFSGLNAGQMREVIYATVYSGETAVSNTLAYSIETYAAKNLDSAAGDLLAAMIKYGDAAAAYAN